MMLWQRRLRYRFSSSPKNRYKRTQSLRSFLRWILLIALVFLLCFGFYRIEERIGALAQQAALSKLNSDITRDVNLAVQDILTQEGFDSRSLLLAEKDENGEIQSVTTDYTTINRMKSALAIRIQSDLDALEIIHAKIPIGMLFSDTLMTGYGFQVPIHVFATNGIIIEFRDEFATAGLNQSRYQLMVEIRIPTEIVGIRRREETEIVTQVPIAETVLIGQIPQGYFPYSLTNP